jgi:hypothetical protein
VRHALPLRADRLTAPEAARTRKAGSC